MFGDDFWYRGALGAPIWHLDISSTNLQGEPEKDAIPSGNLT